MRKQLFHRSLTLAAAAAASLALAACGGGSDNTEVTAEAAQASAQASNVVADELVADNPSTEGKVLAADAGAATQEPL
ncbi:MAG: hypothetical protein MUF76_14825 [Hydrogenophaga sp.]|jgi:protein involved in sex pheromone biosynthesis|nr:hypothetical protein [Hydrogenophaga sp.]